VRIRSTAANVTALLAVALTAACSSDDIPAVPTGSERTALIAALKAVNPAIVTDEDKAIDAARDQCATFNGSGEADMTARERFSTSDHAVTDAEAKEINEALIRTLCS
jgi:hypothetical protein